MHSIGLEINGLAGQNSCAAGANPTNGKNNRLLEIIICKIRLLKNNNHQIDQIFIDN